MTNKLRSAIAGGLAVLASAGYAASTNDVANVSTNDYQVMASAPSYTNQPTMFAPENTSSGVVVRAKGFTPGVRYAFQSKDDLQTSSWVKVGTYITRHTNTEQVVEMLVPAKTKAFYRASTQ